MSPTLSRSGGVVKPLVFAMLLFGYGIGWVHGGFRVAAVEEQLGALRDELKTAKDGIIKVDGRANRMEARCHLNLAEKAISKGDVREAGIRIRQAANLLKAGSSASDKRLAEMAAAISTEAVSRHANEELAALCTELDKDLPIGANMSGGAGQGTSR